MNVLLVAESEAGGREIADRLRATTSEIAISTVTDVELVPRVIEAETVECVVMTLETWRRGGDDLLDRLDDVDPDLPVLQLVDGESSEEIAEMQKRGVSNVARLEEPAEYETLVGRLGTLVELYRLRTEFGPQRPRLQTIVDTLPGMVYRAAIHEPWSMSYVGGRVEDLTGYRAEEIESDEVLWGRDVVVDEDLAEVEVAVEEALDAREEFQVSYRIVTKDGNVKEVWERGRPIVHDGEAVALDGFIMDIGL